MILSDFLSRKSMMTAIHIKLYLFHLTIQGILQTRDYNLAKRNPEKYLVQT